MWAALGKHLEKPIHQFIGGKSRNSVQLAYCVGLHTPEEFRKYARFARNQGFSVLKTKVSRYWQADVERVKAIYDEVDGELEFRVDPPPALENRGCRACWCYAREC